MKVHSSLSGFYKIEAVVIEDGVEVSRRLVADWFKNLVTDAGLNALGTKTISLAMSYCSVGSGSTPPVNTNSALQNKISHTNTIITATAGVRPSPPYYTNNLYTYRFPAGVATGNLSEIGIGWDGTNLFSRALILDGSGNPTTITVLSSETLDVTYELRLYMKTTDDTGVVTLAGSKGGDFNWVMRSSNVIIPGSSSGWIMLGMFENRASSSAARVYDGELGAITSSPAGTTTYLTLGQFIASPYVENSKRCVFSTTIAIGVGNLVGGIRSFLIPLGPGMFQIRFGRVSDDATIDKTSVDTLSLSIFHSWGRM